MAAASPTPVHSYGNGRVTRHASNKPFVRRDSPLSALSQSQGFSSGALPLRSMGVGDDSEDDDLQPPPQLSALGRSVLEQYAPTSPAKHPRPSKIRISRTSSGSNTPARDHITPAPSLRVKRVGLQGAPVRRARRTPQGEDEQEPPQFDPHTRPEQYEHPPSLDQENLPTSIQRPQKEGSIREELVKPDPGSIMKPPKTDPISANRDRAEKPAALAPANVNIPYRPAPPPPPKMSVLETATKDAGASTAKQKRKRSHFLVNGKIYSQIKRLGKGGSSDVYQVMAENSAVFALKRVKLAGADENAVQGYKGEIDLLKKLAKVDRVVHLIDYQIDEEKQCLYVVMDCAEVDFARILRTKIDGIDPDGGPSQPSTSSPNSFEKLDIPFTRYFWQEMLECVRAVHEHDIVHSDLKPANFVLSKGQLKLIDFGIANAIDIENTVNVHRDSHVGTPNYMSPESLQDSSTTAAQSSCDGAANNNVQVSMGKLMKLGKPSDVWSLGCILYQLVYGRPPFAHIANPLHRVMAIINPSVGIQYPPTGIGGVRVPPELRRTLKSCLQRDPKLRPTVAQLLSDNDPFLHPEAAQDLRIPQDLLAQIIWRIAERFRDKGKPPPTDDEIRQYAGSFYAKIREWAEES